MCTTASISNLANLPEIDLKMKVVATAASDVVFGTGYNCMSAATYKAIDSRKEIKAAKTPDRSYYTTPRTNPAKVQSYETIYRNGGWVNVAF